MTSWVGHCVSLIIVHPQLWFPYLFASGGCIVLGIHQFLSKGAHFNEHTLPPILIRKQLFFLMRSHSVFPLLAQGQDTCSWEFLLSMTMAGEDYDLSVACFGMIWTENIQRNSE